MSTTDVPGAKSANNDVLAMGCWAEHEDGSLIFVESVEAGTVVYSMFDVSAEPVVEYRDAMPEKGFAKRFSWLGKNDVKWTWHDKTAFPWERVMEHFPPGSRTASAGATMSTAARVARHPSLRGGPGGSGHRARPAGPEATTALPWVWALDGSRRDPTASRRALRELALRQGGSMSVNVDSDTEIIHGRTSSYTNRKCRCPACSEAKAAERRSYYLRTKIDQAMADADEESKP
jgi:hypothetical protein